MGGELLVQRRLHDAGAAAPLGAEAVQEIVEFNFRQPQVRGLVEYALVLDHGIERGGALWLPVM